MFHNSVFIIANSVLLEYTVQEARETLKAKSESDRSSREERANLSRLVQLKLTEQGKHYLAVNYAERSGMTMKAAELKVKNLFERGKVYVMKLIQLQTYVGDPSECTGTLIVPKSIKPLTRTDATSLERR